MSEYIKREQVPKLLESAQAWSWSMNTLYDEIQALPAEDVVPVVHGKWLNFYGDFTCAECSECGAIYNISANEKSNEDFFREFAKDYNYCPKCGAKCDLEG